jgi:hypothetical protein
MNGIAALAAKEAAVASGFGANLLTGVAPSAVDGFAVGTMLSGICFLLVMAPRYGLRRSRLSSREGMWAHPAAASVTALPTTTSFSDPFADESAEIVVPSVPSGRDEGHAHDVKGGGYRSKHRMADSGSGERRPESRRSAPRHAAPSNSIGSRMAGRLPLHPLAVRG